MRTFICIASGPSLTPADCELVSRSGFPIVAVNSTWRAVPDCHYIYAADRSWWDKYHPTITTAAERWTCSMGAALKYGLNYFPHPDRASFNSGQRAIQLAARLGAMRVLLLGYDCSIENGRHWHGDHPGDLKNPDACSVERWHAEFSRVLPALPGLEVINCSRRSALSCFPFSTIEKALHA